MTEKKAEKAKEAKSAPKGELRGYRVWNPAQTNEVQHHEVAGRPYTFFSREGQVQGCIFSADKSMKETIDYFVKEKGFKVEEVRR